jgi:SAM-dependent methyltransferase
MGGVEEAVQVGAAPARQELEPRIGGREEPPQPIEPDGAEVPGLDDGGERLRAVGPHAQLALRPASASTKGPENKAGGPVVHRGEDDERGLSADHLPMDHADHVALIRAGVEGAGPGWLELGAGEGAFTLALADVLGSGGEIVALDRDGAALARAQAAVRATYPGVAVVPEVADFTRRIPPGPFDGVLAANSLHFVRGRGPLLAAIRAALATNGGRLVVVEYDADRGNPWVPHPFSFETWRTQAQEAGFQEPRLLHRVGSRFLGAIYGAVTSPIRPSQAHGTTTWSMTTEAGRPSASSPTTTG